MNADADQPWYVGERKAALYGTDETYLEELAGGMEEGSFPRNDREVVLSSNARLALDVKPGDTVTLETPAGASEYTVSGFGSDEREYYEGQTYLVAVYMTEAAFEALLEENGVTAASSSFMCSLRARRQRQRPGRSCRRGISCRRTAYRKIRRSWAWLGRAAVRL